MYLYYSYLKARTRLWWKMPKLAKLAAFLRGWGCFNAGFMAFMALLSVSLTLALILGLAAWLATDQLCHMRGMLGAIATCWFAVTGLLDWSLVTGLIAGLIGGPVFFLIAYFGSLVGLWYAYEKNVEVLRVADLLLPLLTVHQCQERAWEYAERAPVKAEAWVVQPTEPVAFLTA